MNKDITNLSINTIRTLAMDAVQKANSGHPGMPMGCAPIAYVLWTKLMNYDPKHPEWTNRDRFVLSAGHGSILLYSMLHLTGYDISLDDIKNFRQWGSVTAGHPEYWDVPGIETTTGPLGQGFTNGVGMAIAAKHLGAVFNQENYPIFDHNIYAICSDGDLMEGIASESASLAGHLGLDNLIYFYDDNHISIEGNTSMSFTEDVDKRFEAYGWHVQRVEDGNDIAAIEKAAKRAKTVKGQPHLISVRTHIAYGSPNKQDHASAHGSPLGEDEVKLTKEILGWDPEKKFYVPAEVQSHMETQTAKRSEQYAQWIELYKNYKNEHPDLAKEWERRENGNYPDGWEDKFRKFKPEDGKMATRKASGAAINDIAGTLPELIGGSADLAPSTKTLIDTSDDFEKGAYANRNLRFGVREHAMGGILNGMSLYKGIRPYGATFLIFSDYMRPTLRLAAMMERPNIYVYTHDSIGLGEDGPTHQPVEQLASLRAMPNLLVLRPADANEVVEAWKIALKQTDRPAALVLTRQGLPIFDRRTHASAEGVAKGGYVIKDSDGEPQVILLATGSEVSLALESKKALDHEGIATRVVSFPSWELFEEQDKEYQQEVLPPRVTQRVAIEAGRHTGWERYVGPDGEYVTVETYGSSAPGGEVMEHYGFNVDNVVKKVKSIL